MSLSKAFRDAAIDAGISILQDMKKASGSKTKRGGGKKKGCGSTKKNSNKGDACRTPKKKK